MGFFLKPSNDNGSKPKKKRGSWLMGLLVGGAVGSVLSLLFAPHEGKETRRKAAESSKKVWDEIKKVIDEWGD